MGLFGPVTSPVWTTGGRGNDRRGPDRLSSVGWTRLGGRLMEANQIKPFHHYRHIKSDTVYIVGGFCRYKHESSWYDAVEYRTPDTWVMYVRQIDDFCKAFEVFDE